MSFSSFKDLREEKSVFIVLGLAVRLTNKAAEGDFTTFSLFEPYLELTPAFDAPDMPVLGRGLLLSELVAFRLDSFVLFFD